MRRITTYINDCVQELHHVRWPTRQQAVRLSIIVLGFVAVSTAVFGLMDFGLAQVFSFLLSFT